MVWAAPPCSSFSLLRLTKAGRRLRRREEPEDLGRLTGAEREYVELHNRLAALRGACAWGLRSWGDVRH